MDRELYEYKQYIRKFPTYNVLEYFSKESRRIFANYNNGIDFEKTSIYSKKGNIKVREVNLNIAQWDLLEVSFNSIKYGNDNRTKYVNLNDFYTLINKTRLINEKQENLNNFSDDTVFKHLICISNMEFDFEYVNILGRFNRLYYIMNVINKNPKYNQTKDVNYINFNKIFKKITTFDYDRYVKCYMFIVLLAVSREVTDFMDIVNSINIDINKLGFSKEDIKDIIKKQSRDYSFYREANNWNVLKYNPIVHCEKFSDKYIISNIPALLISFSEFMYWTIRNHYSDLKSQDFTNYFGHCFEYYLNDFFDTYNINYKKLVESKSKVPDWQIETENFIFLVEQKSSLYPIDTRDITSDTRIETLDKYLSNNIKKAFYQLNNYNLDSKKTIIRICLTFEQIYFPETIENILLPKIENIKDSSLNWLVSINDFEKLFIILSKNSEEFNNIIFKKIESKKGNNSNSSFDTILSKYDNDYILNKINYFKKIGDNMKSILKTL